LFQIENYSNLNNFKFSKCLDLKNLQIRKCWNFKVLKSFKSSRIEKSLGFKNSLNELTEKTRNLEGNKTPQENQRNWRKLHPPP
jgi:hypothetical protein